MTGFVQDIRYAFRQLRRSPGFAVTAVMTMAVGIGASTAVFSVVDAALLKPLPFVNQDRLVSVNTRSRSGYTQPVSYPSYLDMRGQLSTFEALAGFSTGTKNLETGGDPVTLQVVSTTDNFFNVFGVHPLLGRTFLPGEEQDGKNNLVVLSNEVWKNKFAARRDIVNSTVRLDGTPYTVIGVMPPVFRYPLSSVNAIYTPLHSSPALLHGRNNHWMRTIGLIKPGVDPQHASQDLRQVMSNIARAYPETDEGRTGVNVPLTEQVTGQTSAPLHILALGVLALLVIACVNVASLLLARGVQRGREIALRAAVGASRARLLRQLITESSFICAAGLVVGVVLAYGLLSAARVFLISALARGSDVHVDVRALLVAMAISAVAGVVAGLAPALRLSGTNPNNALRSGGNAGTGRGQHRLRSGFIVTQVALSLVLVVVSGILMHNLQRYLKADLGYEPDRILALDVNLATGRYAGRDPLVSFYQPLIERVQHLPGVTAAGIINLLPLRDYGFNSDVHITGQAPYPKDKEMLAEQRYVSPGYFDAMGLHLLRGRNLDPSIDNSTRKAGTAIVNQAFQRKFLAGGNVVGAHIDDDPVDKTELVGLVTNARQNIYGSPLAEMDYLVDELSPAQRLANLPNMLLIVRAQGDPSALIGSLRGAIHDVDPTVPFNTPTTLTDVLSTTLVFERMQSWLFGIFAGFALALSLVGIYGMVKHEVELRTREIGVRMALGSTRARVLTQILRHVSLLMIVGLTTGWIITGLAHKILATLVQLRMEENLAMLVAVTVGLGAVGVAASVLPARKAASIDPITALRIE